LSLFDPEPYTAKGKTPREDKNRPVPPRPATVNVHTNDDWRVVTKHHPGVVHMAKGSSQWGGWETWCGITAGKRTFPAGIRVDGCKACFTAHAHDLMTRAQRKANK
jgi:hypothetical protein